VTALGHDPGGQVGDGGVGTGPGETKPRWPRLLLCPLLGIGVAFAMFAATWHRTIAQGAAETPVARAAIAAAPTDLVAPTAEQTLILIRSTLLTLNDALRSGNFTVLRDLGSPSFREANTAGRLAQIFSGLSSKGIDLSAVAILAPQIPHTPAIDQNRRLKISGAFPGQPIQINFDLLFEAHAGRWRLQGLSVEPVHASSAALSPPAAMPTGTETARPAAVMPPGKSKK
jgi:hypothetical protein